MLTDICITTALLWQLNRSGLYSRQNMQTKRYLSFYDRHISRLLSIPPSLHRLVAKLSSLAIKTGVVPCVFALLTLVTYITYKNSNITLFFAYMLGRVYTSTMLYSLLYRDKLYSDGELMTDIDSTSLPPMTCEPNYFYFRSLIFQYDGIVSFDSSPPSLQIPPLALSNGKHGQGAYYFLRYICHLSYH